MGTRYFCDHCGNTVQKFTELAFGDLNSIIKGMSDRHEAMQQMQALRLQGVGAPGGNVAQGPYAQTPSAKPPINIMKVELCDNCVPIWMERVNNLCKQSDTDV